MAGLTVIRLIMITLGFAFVICLSQTAYAKDFGKYGVTTDIKEEGFIAMIARKLKTVDMTKEQQKMQKLAQDRINEPIPVTGIVRTTKARSFTFDPTYTLDQDIILPCGKLLHPRGTKINPLDHMDLAKRMIFIDARDELQEKWLKERIEIFRIKVNGSHAQVPGSKELEHEELVIILVGGRPLQLQGKINYEVYFDQGGLLTSKFGIKQVPATIVQEEKFLRISGVNIDSYKTK